MRHRASSLVHASVGSSVIVGSESAMSVLARLPSNLSEYWDKRPSGFKFLSVFGFRLVHAGSGVYPAVINREQLSLFGREWSQYPEDPVLYVTRPSLHLLELVVKKLPAFRCRIFQRLCYVDRRRGVCYLADTSDPADMVTPVPILTWERFERVRSAPVGAASGMFIWNPDLPESIRTSLSKEAFVENVERQMRRMPQ